MRQRDQLEKLLKDRLPDFSDREIIAWGTGNTALLAQQGLKRFSAAHPWFSISAYCDSSTQKWGTVFCGKPVISPEQLCERMPNAVAIICAQSPGAISAIRSRLKEMCVPSFLLDEVILKTEAENVLRCYDLLEDAESGDTYDSIIRGRVLGSDAPDLRPVPMQYFAHPALKRRRSPEVFVDCGSFIGDTLEELLRFENGRIEKYIAFESDADNYRILVDTAEKLKKKWSVRDESMILYDCAVGDRDGEVYSLRNRHNSGAASLLVTKKDAAVTSCRIVTLDRFLQERYTFLKADIESCEYSMLCGAKRGIRKNKPFMAICIYHNAVDLYSIPLLIHGFDPDYRFSVKHHSLSIADPYADTVLYCHCEE